MEVVLDAEGGLKERQSYTPWGERREGGGSTVSESGRRLGSKVRPGYTGHEMLDEVGIIHMNGRLYDPEIGRMLGPDPIVQESDNTQNYNAYSYVLNNPMRFTDPSGYSWFGKLFRSIGKFFKKIARSIKKAFKKVRTWVKRNYKKIIVVAVAAVAIVVTYGAATAWSWAPAAMTKAGAVAFGAVSGGAMGAAQAAMAGGSWSDIFRAGCRAL
jgi:RHS repeat-associated protein